MTDNEDRTASFPGSGLCDSCRYKRIILSERGSRFLLCELSGKDSRFPKYPPLPVINCDGYTQERASSQ